MKNVFYTLVVIFYSYGICSAQKIPSELDPRNYPNGTAILHESELVVFAADISEFDVLDTTRYRIMYHFDYPSNAKAANFHATERMVLEIGKTRTAFYSLELFEDDSLYTYKALKAGISSNFSVDHIRFHVYGSVAENKFEIVQRIPLSSGRAVVIEDSAMPQWEIDTLSSSVLGYPCLRARTHFGGREWMAWFAPEIPLGVGPWKLWGLPGLILKAEDSRHCFSFECFAIMKDSRPIKKYKWHYISMNHHQWLNYEKRMHKSPYAILGKNTLVLSLGEHPGRMDENWEAPFCPLELDTKSISARE